MKFHPTSTMRYVAALRTLIQKNILRDGFTKKHREGLKKIYLYEGVKLTDAYVTAAYMPELTDSLFGAAVIGCAGTGTRLSTEISCGTVRVINLRLYEILVSSLVSSVCVGGNACFEFFETENGVRLSARGDIVKSDYKKIAALMSGVSVLLESSKVISVFIPCERSDDAPAVTPSEIEYLFEEYSVPNIFCAELFGRSI